MLLATNTAIAQQILDVEKPTGHTVDFILAVTSAKETTGDRDFFEFDRHEPGGVVERDRHFGSSERLHLGCASKDDIVHLLRPHRAGTLSAQHPRKRIDHVGLTTTVRANNNRDARLEIEARRRSERLETFESKGLQKHNRMTLTTSRTLRAASTALILHLRPSNYICLITNTRPFVYVGFGPTKAAPPQK